MIRRLALVLAVIIGITGFGTAFGSGQYGTAEAYAATEPPTIIGEAGILIDGTTGEILYTKNEHMQLEPASTTKMITCLLALENLDEEQVLIIDQETSFTEGSRIYLIEDEQITVENVLYALMLESANDAAVGLGKAISGSVQEFAVKMNERAKELGALNTNFVNPHGLHADGHLSTVYDLAMIAKGCMENERFRELVTTYYHNIPATNKQEERHMYNTNRLLYDERTKVPVGNEMRPAKYDGILGVKTGYTSHAGGCLVAAAERNGTYLIAAVMKSTDEGRFGDCIALLDYGFENYHTVQAVDMTTPMGTMEVKKGAVKEVGLALENDSYVTLPIEASAAILNPKIELQEEVRAPIEKGQVLGKMDVYAGDSVIASVNIVATETVEEGTFLSVFGIEDKTANKIFIITGIIVFVLVALVVSYIVLVTRRNKRRRLRRQQRALAIARERAAHQRDIEKRDWRF